MDEGRRGEKKTGEEERRGRREREERLMLESFAALCNVR